MAPGSLIKPRGTTLRGASDSLVLGSGTSNHAERPSPTDHVRNQVIAQIDGAISRLKSGGLEETPGLSQLAELRRQIENRRLSTGNLWDIRQKAAEISKGNAMPANEFAAYALEMSFRGRYALKGSRPFTDQYQNLETAILTINQAVKTRTQLLEKTERLSGNVQSGRLTPQEGLANTLHLGLWVQSLTQVENLLKSHDLPKDHVDALEASFRRFGKPGGLSRTELDAQTLDLANRAQHQLPGPLTDPYPDQKRHLVSGVNTLEAVSTAQQQLVVDLEKMASSVGMPGGMTAEEFKGQVLKSKSKLFVLNEAAKALRRYQVSTQDAQELRKLAVAGDDESLFDKMQALLRILPSRSLGRGALMESVLNTVS